MKSKAAALSKYLFYYYLFFFISIILVAVINDISPSITQVPVIRYSLIGIPIYSCFMIVEYRAHTRRSSLTALLDITFFGKIIAILRAKNYPKPNLDVEVREVFLSGLTLSVFVVAAFSLYSFFVLSSPLLQGLPSTSNPSLNLSTITLASFEDNPGLIIETNLVFLSEILIGSILLYSVAFSTILFDGALLGPAIVTAIGQGKYSLLFPHGLLELLGTATAAGTGLLIFYAVATLTTENPGDARYSRREKFMTSSIILLVILSVYAFVLAWPIEYTILLSFVKGSSLPSNWFASVYLFDALMILDYALVFHWIFRERFFSPVKLGYLFLLPGILLFTLIGGSSSFGTNQWFSFLFFIPSLFLPIREICSKTSDRFRSRKEEFKIKKLGNEGFDFLTTHGHSMKPTIGSREILLTYTNMDGLDLQIGDIVSYHPSMMYTSILGSKYITHRIVELDEKRMVTKGDNIPRTDPATSPGNVDRLIVAKLVPKRNSSAYKFVPLTNNANLRETGEKLVSSYCDKELTKSLVTTSRSRFAVFSLSLFLSVMVPAIVMLL